MKTISKYGMVLLTATLASIVPAQSSDVEANIGFNGTVRNSIIRQTVQGNFSGTGEFNPFGIDGKIEGTVRTQAGQRPSRRSVYGNYPVRIFARAHRGEETITDSFNASAYLTSGYLVIRGYGKIALRRSVAPTLPGSQVLVGRGDIHYNY